MLNSHALGGYARARESKLQRDLPDMEQRSATNLNFKIYWWHEGCPVTICASEYWKNSVLSMNGLVQGIHGNET